MIHQIYKLPISSVLRFFMHSSAKQGLVEGVVFERIHVTERNRSFRLFRDSFYKVTDKRGIVSMLLALFFLFFSKGCVQYEFHHANDVDPEEVFEYLWNDLNNRYSYFELKSIDWHAVRVEYQAKIHPGLDRYELFEILADLLFELRDGHVNLTSDFDRSRNWEWFQGFADNYNQNNIDRNYLGTDFRVTGPLLNQVIDSVLYVNYRSFSSQISKEHLDELMIRAQGLKGVIIDIRSNGGGSLGNALRLASAFADQERVYVRERVKNGPGMNDFSIWHNNTIHPRNGLQFSGPVVVLTNRRSYSSSTFFAQMMRVIPQVTLMGDKTGGGGGSPAFGELPNGWRYRFSATQNITPEGEHLEIGIPVDIEVHISPATELAGFDDIIEAALEFLK